MPVVVMKNDYPQFVSDDEALARRFVTEKMRCNPTGAVADGIWHVKEAGTLREIDVLKAKDEADEATGVER